MLEKSRISHQRQKMTILGLSFIVLTICGCWRPSSWSTSFYKRFAYNLYSIFLIFLIVTLLISEVIAIVLNTDNSSHASDDIYLLLEEFTSFCKMLSLLINSNGIAKLMDILAREPFKSLNDEEERIQTKFEKLLRFSTRSYMYMVELSTSSFIFLSLITDLRRRKLMLRAWLPFDNTSSHIFYVTYIHQILALLLGSILHVGLDTLICGFLIHICCQINILENRFTKITNERRAIVKLCICHHESIYKFAATVNQMFQFIIFIQFFISTSTVCFTLYQLTKVSVASLDFVTTLLYMSCMLMQVYLYCWYGHAVTLESHDIANHIYSINWPELNIGIRKNLLVMMKRTVMPITFTPLNILPMNLESFVSILKTSYSAYNILKQTQEQ